MIQHGSHICLIVEFQGLMVAKKILETGILDPPEISKRVVKELLNLPMAKARGF